MSKDVVLKYFKEHHSSYSLEDLKKKVLDAGYKREDVDAALKSLREGANKERVPAIERKEVGFVNKQRGRKWMKFAGILGSIFLVFGVLNILLVLFNISNPIGFLPGGVWVESILVILLLAAMYFYFYGFFKMGKAVDSKLLRVSAIMNIVAIFSIIIISIIASIIVWSILGSMDNQLVSGIDSSGDFSNLVLVVIFILVAIVILVTRIMFSVALVKVGKDIRFAKIAGVLGLILLCLGLIFSGFIIYLISNPFILLAFFMSEFWLIVFYAIAIIMGSLNLLVLLFESLSLFNGSKKFE